MKSGARHVKPISALLMIVGTALVVSTLPAPFIDRPPQAGSAFPEIVLQVNDTTVSPYDSVYKVSVWLTNTLSDVAGFSLQLAADQANLVGVVDTSRVDTSITCDSLSVCDTTIDTVVVSSVDMTGSAIAGWEYLQPRAISPQTFRFTGLADLVGGGTVAPLPAGGDPHYLFSMLVRRLAPLDVLDTLQNRTVAWSVSFADFSDPNGNLIGLQESTFCVNPPVCDTIDTTHYYDSTINIFVDGAVTIGPTCILGDLDANGSINSADIITLVNYVFRAGPVPPCEGVSADVDCNGAVNASDIILLVNYVYRGGLLTTCW